VFSSLLIAFAQQKFDARPAKILQSLTYHFALFYAQFCRAFRPMMPRVIMARPSFSVKGFAYTTIQCAY
jgi:hypothetical protein